MVLSRTARLIACVVLGLIAWALDWATVSPIAFAKGGGGGGKAPSAAPAPTPALGPGQLAHTALPGAKADATARAGGGISPEFLAALVAQQSGAGSGGLDILGEIQAGLGNRTGGV